MSPQRGQPSRRHVRESVSFGLDWTGRNIRNLIGVLNGGANDSIISSAQTINFSPKSTASPYLGPNLIPIVIVISCNSTSIVI